MKLGVKSILLLLKYYCVITPITCSVLYTAIKICLTFGNKYYLCCLVCQWTIIPVSLSLWKLALARFLLRNDGDQELEAILKLSSLELVGLWYCDIHAIKEQVLASPVFFCSDEYYDVTLMKCEGVNVESCSAMFVVASLIRIRIFLTRLNL